MNRSGMDAAAVFCLPIMGEAVAVNVLNVVFMNFGFEFFYCYVTAFL